MLKIKNWSSYQSYKDRKPPWIRLHKTMLDNFEYHSMSANARSLLPMLWLLASEDIDPVSGLIRNSYESISFRLRISIKDLTSGIKECLSSGFIEQIQDCNETVTKPYLNRNQTVTPETETETETETEKYIFENFWEKYPRQRRGDKHKTFLAWKSALKKATAQEIQNGLEAYIGSSHVSNGYAKGAAAWLNDSRWTWDYAYEPKKQAEKTPAEKDRESRAGAITL